MAMPRAMGGLGLTRMELIAPAAFHASVTTALSGERRVPNQATLAAIINRDVLDRTCAGDEGLRRHLAVHSLDGSDVGLSHLGSRVHPDVFGALLRTVLMADAVTVTSSSLPCRGCRGSFAVGGAWGQHVASCVVAPGGHVTKRHNAVAALLRTGLAEAGMQPDKSEPRDLARYRCRCGLDLLHEAFVEHRKQCQHGAKQPLHVSGPDIRYTSGGVTTVADVTVVSLLTASHWQQSAEDAFSAARATKVASYGHLCAAAGVRLVPLPATANGHLGPELIAMANTIADRTFRERRTIRAELSAAIAHGSAVARLAAEEAGGLRPRSIAMQQVRLMEQFRHTPLDVAADSTRSMALPPLLPAPGAPASLEQRIALGVDAALRAALPRLAEVWVSAARAAAEQHTRELRAAQQQEEAAAGGNDNNNNNNNNAAPDAEAAAFRARVAAQADFDEIERRTLERQSAAAEAVERERAALHAAAEAIEKETAARLQQLQALEVQASRETSHARACSERLQRAESVAAERIAAATAESDELALQLRVAHEAACATLRRAQDRADAAMRDAAVADDTLREQHERADAQLAAADAARRVSSERAASMAAHVEAEAAALAEASRYAAHQEQLARLSQRRSIASAHRASAVAHRGPSESFDGATVMRPSGQRTSWHHEHGGDATPETCRAPPFLPRAPRSGATTSPSRSRAAPMARDAHSVCPPTQLRPDHRAPDGGQYNVLGRSAGDAFLGPPPAMTTNRVVVAGSPMQSTADGPACVSWLNQTSSQAVNARAAAARSGPPSAATAAAARTSSSNSNNNNNNNSRAAAASSGNLCDSPAASTADGPARAFWLTKNSSQAASACAAAAPSEPSSPAPQRPSLSAALYSSVCTLIASVSPSRPARQTA